MFKRSLSVLVLSSSFLSRASTFSLTVYLFSVLLLQQQAYAQTLELQDAHHGSEPRNTRGRSVSRKRSARGGRQTDRILRQPCRYYLKGTCTRSPCECWHPPECQFYKTESGCKNNQTKSQRKATIPTKEEKATTRMLWLL